MRWRNVQTNVQTNEYDLQAKTYPTICTYHKLRNNNENKVPVFPKCICNKWQNMMWQTSQAHNHGTRPLDLGKHPLNSS